MIALGVQLVRAALRARYGPVLVSSRCAVGREAAEATLAESRAPGQGHSCVAECMAPHLQAPTTIDAAARHARPALDRARNAAT